MMTTAVKGLMGFGGVTVVGAAAELTKTGGVLGELGTTALLGVGVTGLVVVCVVMARYIKGLHEQMFMVVKENTESNTKLAETVAASVAVDARVEAAIVGCEAATLARLTEELRANDG